MCRPCPTPCPQAADTVGAEAAGSRQQRKRKGRGEPLLLRSQVILQQAHKAKPVLQHRPPRKVNGLVKQGEQPKRQTKFSSIPGTSELQVA